jgi:hypothetical protein
MRSCLKKPLITCCLGLLDVYVIHILDLTIRIKWNFGLNLVYSWDTAAKGYKCINYDMRIFIARHVQFDETCFPLIKNKNFFANSTGSSMSNSNFVPTPAIPIVPSNTANPDYSITNQLGTIPATVINTDKILL